MDYWVILYSLVCVLVGGGAVNFLYKRGQMIGAILALVLLILIFVFYGLRWFPDGNLNGSKRSDKPVAWPPIINVCPDFMVTWTDRTDNKVYCYDANNVYGLQRATGASPLVSNKTINSASGQSAYLIKDPSQATGATNVGTGAARWPLAAALSTNSNTVLTPAAALMRWEGIWNGGTLNTATIPLP